MTISSKGGFIKDLSTTFKSRIGVGSLIYRKRFLNPLMNLVVLGRANTENLSTREQNIIIAAACTLTEFIDNPDPFNPNR